MSVFIEIPAVNRDPNRFSVVVLTPFDEASVRQHIDAERPTPALPGPTALLLWIRRRQTDFLGLFLILFLACSYFVTEILFTDHTIPNSFLQVFPSPRIAAEGRWGHELIIQLLGGAGNQALFNLLGMMTIVLNGFLFAELMQVSGRANRFIVASLVALSPIFLEYYSFSIDAFPYAIGDMTALLGVLALARIPAIWPQLVARLSKGNAPFKYAAAIATRTPPLIAGVITSAALFTFTLGIYQPKISLIAVVIAFYLLSEFSTTRSEKAKNLQCVAAAVVSFVVAVFLYWLSYQLIALLADSEGYNRSYVNSFAEMRVQIIAAYSEIYQMCLGFARAIPLLANLSLILLMGTAVALILRRAFRNGLFQGVFSVALIALLPIGMRLSYVINQETFADIARVMPSVAFMAAFASAICLGRLKIIAVGASLIVAWSSFTALTQESNAAAMKTWHETAMVTRIVARIEPLLQPGEQNALVVLGNPKFDDALYLSAPDRPLRPQTKKPAFLSYRQIAIMNFMLGDNVVTGPSNEQRERARNAAEGHEAWPAPDAVFRDGNVIVVLLDADYAATEVTR